jgi:hypothetical protein
MAKKSKAFNFSLLKPGKITVYVYIVVICLIIGFTILGFISSFNKSDKYKKEAITNCIHECNVGLGRGDILATGPCLSNSIAPDWVCDTVNKPRNNFVDDQKENQCSSFVDGTNRHFVEVSTNCELVRAI